jgi:hypothetical protein
MAVSMRITWSEKTLGGALGMRRIRRVNVTSLKLSGFKDRRTRDTEVLKPGIW